MTSVTEGHWITGLLSERAKMAGKGPVGLDPKSAADVIAFGGGYPDHSTLPINDLLESTRIALERDGEWALQYAFGAGIPELVDALRDKLRRDQGIAAEPNNILITNGASQALGLIFEAFVNPGDPILTEAPFFLGAVNRCRASGADAREVPLDEDGLVVSELESRIRELKGEGKHPRFLYVVPTFQNPTGITYSLERRKQIIDICREHQIPILEDDAYYDLRFSGDHIPTFYELADPGMVLYVGTFSKIIGAGLRLGWVVADPDIIGHLTGLKTDASTNTVTSHIVAEFTSSGTLAEHITQLRSLYRHRCEVMLRALESQMPEGVEWTKPDGGFFIWVTLPKGMAGAEIAEQARARGVGVGVGTFFFTGEGGENNIRLSYSFNTDEEIESGIATLAEVIREQMS
ncbi:MAG: PLP-dependent aminotransferase family protein [Chloroflexota bacterium]